MKTLRLALTALLLTLPLSAQQDGGASLTIRFADGVSRFHAGEIIPIELSFRAAAPDMYDMEMRNYDRSGRLNIEQFHVTPPGRDPLQSYYSIWGFIGGGIGGTRALSSEPQIVREDLNEWVALDKPGHYSLYVTSGRVSRRGPAKNEPVELRSNSLDFDVIAAEPEWQQQTLNSASATLNMESATDQEKTGAFRTLRFLDTPESIRELVRLLGAGPEGSRWNEIAGLAGSRYQSLVVRELEQQMSAPDMALSGSYLQILAKLKFQLDHEPLPPYPEKDTQQQKTWNERRQAQDKGFTELQDALFEKAASLVSSKQGIARAETVQTLLLRPSRGPSDVKPLVGLPAEEVASAFLNLSQDQQWNLLSTFWDRLKVPEMAVPLRKVVEQPDMKHQMLRDVALRRLYDLDPAEATPIFLREIRKPHLDNGMFTVKSETLGLLPNETLPQFDEVLFARLQDKESRTKDLDAQLVGRYGTRAILTKIKNAYEASADNGNCVAADGFLRYFLRVDPDYGVKHLAMSPGLCMTASLAAVTKMQRWSEIEPSVIARLNGPDLNWGRNAAEMLAKFGSPKAEKAMWERLRRFHAQWEERGNDLAYRSGMPSDASEAMSFQFGLVEAIGKAQAWLLTNEEVTVLESLTLGQERDSVKQWRWNSPVDLNISFFGDQMQATMNQYFSADLASLRSKLAQYPGGTKFRLNISGPPDRVSPVLAEIDDIAAQRGFWIDSPPSAP